MQQHQMSQVPPPPPAHRRPSFPGMPGLVNDFGRVHLEPHGHHFEPNMHRPAIQIIQPPGYGHIPGPHSFPSNGKAPVNYVGYIFTKQPVEHVGRKETWAIVNRERMPGSQPDLKSQIEKHRKRGDTGLSQYNDPDMKGFKRKQIDELIRDCDAMDMDRRFQYVVASIRRETRRGPRGIETSTMQVILKRLTRSGIDMHGPFMGFDSGRLPSSGIVDLSGAEDSERSSQNGSNGHRPGAYPFEPWVHVGHAGEKSPASSHDLGEIHADVHAEAGNQHAHGQEQPAHPHPGHTSHEEAHDTNGGHKEKAKKHKNKKRESPKYIVIERHEKHKSHEYHSDSSSFSDSDSSSGDTDRTSPTIISSEGSHYQHKDRNYRKEKHHRKSSPHDHEHEPIEVIYREHKRKEPTRRLSPPPPSHRSHYRHEDVYIEPGFTSHRRPVLAYAREQVPYHHRAMNYDDERLHDYDMRGLGRRPTAYRRRIISTVPALDPFEERAERRRHEVLDGEIWEKEEAARRREKARSDAIRERMEPERMYHAHPRYRTDRMHAYHDDHLHRSRDDHY